MSSYYQQELHRLRAIVFPHAHRRQQVLQARQFIEAHYAEPIGLPDVAAAAGCSRFHFLRLFRQYYGRTPHQYLTTVRLREARRLLLAGASATEACFAVGFDSVSSFTALFRQQMGCPPRTFAVRAGQKSNFGEAPRPEAADSCAQNASL
ncbi:AraC family transcriptional regulator [Hymenobacter gummosus]|uniref:AraC family transcriptional regulator n=1 Tax=Hymenobacter gummosus TaxID=1776032 RepID=A0A3S0H6H2_9BACT|nr:AraC family transcriptional regulator [Hymenobacter gummosus]RTQ50927.1 AraC family transcriptional regulator [Hymenobacter gummosus]